MNIRTITCSDPREDTSIEELLDFMNKNPMVEIAVQATPSKITVGTARSKWFERLLRGVRNNPRPLNLAMHVNQEYCDYMCRGLIPDDLLSWFFTSCPNGKPVIKRWQLNFSGSKTETIDYAELARLIKDMGDREFIMQHDGSQSSGLHLLRLRACMTEPTYSVLYDKSSGNGVSPERWNRPYPGVYTGYAGGLRPENVSAELDRISTVAGRDKTVWVDAEGGLKVPGTKTFSVDRAQVYVNAVMQWQRKNLAR